MLIIGIIGYTLWYIVGVWSFIFWWTEDFDLDVSHFIISLFVGILGPLVFIMGFSIHGKKKDVVLVKRKVNK